MVIPVAIAQLGHACSAQPWARPWRFGVLICTCGPSLDLLIDSVPGATIVVGAIGLYAVGFISAVRLRSLRAPAARGSARTTSTLSRRSSAH